MAWVFIGISVVSVAGDRRALVPPGGIRTYRMSRADADLFRWPRSRRGPRPSRWSTYLQMSRADADLFRWLRSRWALDPPGGIPTYRMSRADADLFRWVRSRWVRRRLKVVSLKEQSSVVDTWKKSLLKKGWYNNGCRDFGTPEGFELGSVTARNESLKMNPPVLLICGGL
jgi:hypothetical protein